MSEMKELRDTLRAVEAAAEGSQALDWRIFKTLNVGAKASDKWERAKIKFDDDDHELLEWASYFAGFDRSAEYSQSLDAVVALIGAQLPGWCVGIVEKHSSRGRWECYVHNNESALTGMYGAKNPKLRWITTHGNSAPLALCAALIDAVMTVKASEMASELDRRSQAHNPTE